MTSSTHTHTLTLAVQSFDHENTIIGTLIMYVSTETFNYHPPNPHTFLSE